MLAYQTFGDTALPPLIVAHGLFGSGRNWATLAKRWSDLRHVVAVDMRNHGASPHHDTHGYPALAQDLSDMIDAFGGRADVLGHSMGGKSSMVLALTAPEKVDRLIIGDIAPVAYDHDQSQYLAAMRRVDARSMTKRSDVTAALTEQGVEPEMVGFFAQSFDVASRQWRYNLDALERDMPHILSFPDVGDAQFDGPTLFLSGAQSDYVTHAYRPQIRALFPKARFAKLNGAGHWLHAEKPDAFDEAVRVFLEAG